MTYFCSDAIGTTRQMTEYNPAKTEEYLVLVYTTQVNSSFHFGSDSKYKSLLSSR